jgi:hypothetical protein
MIRTKRMRAATAAVTIAGTTAAAMLLIPATPAVAYSSGGITLDVVVQSPAHLIAKGAAVGVTVQYTCDDVNTTDLTYSFLNLNLTERVSGGDIAAGGVSIGNLVCTGEIESATFDVTASGPRAFGKGSAYASTDLQICDDFIECATDIQSTTIKIQK